MASIRPTAIGSAGWRQVVLALTSGCYLAASFGVTAAESVPVVPGIDDPSPSPAAPDVDGRPRMRVQPRADESELSPRSAQVVDELYDKLMGEGRYAACKARPGGGRKARLC